MNKSPFILTPILIFTTVIFSACGGGSSSGTVIVQNTQSSVHFLTSQNCATCHDHIEGSIALLDQNNTDVSIVKDWSATMMGNSTKDPLWMAKVASELKRNPHLEDVINDKCTKCHAPIANYEAHQNGDAIKVFGDDGFLNTSNKYHDKAMDGVSCTLCHQIENVSNLGTLESFSGGYEINTNSLIYGPFINPFTNPMIEQVSYTPVHSSHISESKICATCHNLKTPFVDANGDIASTTSQSEFPEQMPYSEWEHSEFKDTKSCQQCHMEQTNGVVISNRPTNGSITAKDNFSRHNFVGANKLMLDILNQNKTALGVSTSADFNKTLQRTDELRSTTASITLEDKGITNDILSIDVNITNRIAHKLPTSFPSRRAFVHFTLYDANNTIIFESGKVNSDGSIVEGDGDSNTSGFEPHYDTITSQTQVQVYEAVMQNTDGEVTHTLLRAASYIKDNRLLPRGFEKTTASSDIAVVGAALNDANFAGGSDRITYEINLNGKTPAKVEVELRYQTLAYPFAKDLFSDDTNESNSFKTMFDASDLKTTTITSQSLTL